MYWKRVLIGFCIFSGAAYYSHNLTLNQYSAGKSALPRRPAAIPKPVGFGYLEGKDFEEVSRRRVVAGMRALAKEGSVGLQVGHFVTRSEDGKSVQACELYDRVRFTFDADGMAVNGASPQLVVEGPCVASENMNEVSPVWVPYQKILSKPPGQGDGEIRFEGGSPVVVSYFHLQGQWPTQWVLAEVKMVNKKAGKSISLTSQEIYKLVSKAPLMMEW